MSLFDQLKKKRKRKKKSVRRLIGAKHITDQSLETYTQGELVFFIVKPHNLAVLSEDTINFKLHALTMILKSVEALEIVSQNSRESFEDNKAFLRERLEIETAPAVRELCMLDLEQLDVIQTQMATAR